jgi:xylulokinase
MLIGVDIGTSSVKAVLVGPGGNVLDRFSATHGTIRSAPGHAEQDAQIWLDNVRAALAQFAVHPTAGQVQAIGITSQVNTHLFCDAALRPLAAAITWQDTRAGAQAAALDARLSLDDKIEALGAPIPIDASHALSRMAWMRDMRPDLWAATRHVLLPKDWVIAALTGQVVADPLSAVGLAGPDLAYAGAVLGLLPRAADLLAPLRDPLSVAGQVTDGPFRDVPVATCTMDAWAAMFGLGVASEGEAMYLSGTSEVLGLIRARVTKEPGIIVFPPWRAITLHAAPTQSGGASLDWLGRLLGRDVPALVEGHAPLRADSPLFLPHLDGERAPLWDTQSRGAFVGLSGATDAPQLAASVMEGVAFAARLALEGVARSGADAVPSLRHGGGGARANFWCQIRADVLGRRLARVEAPESGAMGALVMAGVAAGVLPDLARAAAELVQVDRVFDPDPVAVARSEARFALWQELYAAQRPISVRLLQG